MKKVALPALALALTGMAMAYAQIASAEETTPIQQSLVERIATRFSLRSEDVQAVFNEERQARQQDMQNRLEEQLTQYVNDRKISAQQKQLILKKHEELKTSRDVKFEEFQNRSPQDKRAAHEAERQALEDWAKQNGIDLQYFGMFGRGGLRMEMKGMGRMMDGN